MKPEPRCPRCLDVVNAPGLWSSSWHCNTHGEVLPFQPVVQPSAEVLADSAAHSQVPLWLPWPLPHGWVVTGVAHVGDDRSGARAVALACSGPNPVGGMGELVLVAEEPGIGLGARYAGMPGPDPGGDSTNTAPHAKLHAEGRPTSLWCVEGGAGRAVYVGEAQACWLWAVLWPESAGALLLEDIELCDLREVAAEIPLLPIGALTPRLSA